MIILIAVWIFFMSKMKKSPPHADLIKEQNDLLRKQNEIFDRLVTSTEAIAKRLSEERN